MNFDYEDPVITEKLLSLLIATDTVNPPGNEFTLIQKILEVAEPLPGTYEVISHGDNRASMVLKLEGRDKNKVLGFAGHLDTVPVGEAKSWTHPPFDAQRENGYIYGRGASDMRGGLCAMLLTYLHFTRNNMLPPITLEFFFTADEESDGMGVNALRKSGFFEELSGLIVCEPTDCSPVICEKGTLWLNVECRGKICHASLPEDGVNALELGMRFMQQLKMQIEDFAVPHRLVGPNTCTITEARSGVKINILPDFARFSADIRVSPSSEGGNRRLIKLIEENTSNFQAENGIFFIQTKISGNREAISISERHPFIRLIKNCENQNRSTECGGIRYFTDASLIIPFFPDLPFVVLGPGDSRECHTTDEKIRLDSIPEAVTIYRGFIEQLGDRLDG